MREILFRGKRVDNGEWVYGLPVPVEINTYPTSRIVMVTKWAFDELDAWDFDFEEVLPETVGQCTGLTDKNGQKIFDGDIVHYVYEPLGDSFWNANQNCVIEWKDTGFYLNGIMGTNLYACVSGWLVSIPIGDGKLFEVIGNIHEQGVQ